MKDKLLFSWFEGGGWAETWKRYVKGKGLGFYLERSKWYVSFCLWKGCSLILGWQDSALGNGYQC